MPIDGTKNAHTLSAAVQRIATRWRDTSGNVAIITAMLMPVLIAVAGFGMDYAYAAFVKQRLDRAAEAAVIGAVSQNAATAGGGYSNLSWLYNYGLNLFTGNVSQLSVGTVTPTLTVTKNGNGAIATLSYSASVPTLFSGIVGIKSFPLTGTASAKASGLTYINYYIVVDISQSMGIGSTSTDMTNLYNRTATYNGSGCVFGCHVLDSGQAHTNEYLAHSISPTITLRIDAAVSAIQSIIGSAKTAAGSQNNIQIGLYTMSKDPVTGKLLNTISSPSSNFSSLASLAGTIDLGNNIPNSGGDGDSDFVDQLTQFNTVIPASGSGASATSPLNYVFIITDGMIDTPGCTYGFCTGAFSSSYCTALKTKATVGVIYTTYLPIYTNNNPADGYHLAYAVLAEPYVGQIPTNLQSCASSSSYYFEASDGPAINSAMQSLFAQTLSTATLTP